jgi:hypothetical protein
MLQSTLSRKSMSSESKLQARPSRKCSSATENNRHEHALGGHDEQDQFDGWEGFKIEGIDGSMTSTTEKHRVTSKVDSYE